MACKNGWSSDHLLRYRVLRIGAQSYQLKQTVPVSFAITPSINICRFLPDRNSDRSRLYPLCRADPGQHPHHDREFQLDRPWKRSTFYILNGNDASLLGFRALCGRTQPIHQEQHQMATLCLVWLRCPLDPFGGFRLHQQHAHAGRTFLPTTFLDFLQLIRHQCEYKEGLT